SEPSLVPRSGYPKSTTSKRLGRQCWRTCCWTFLQDRKINFEKYLDLLINHVIPSCRVQFLVQFNVINQQLRFQPDGAPPHFAANVTSSKEKRLLFQILGENLRVVI
ncbi:hypothetical protein NQ318_009139, partial [Aromia moschata]